MIRLAASLAMLPGLLLPIACRAEERILHRSRSEYNEILVRETSEGLRVLQFEDGGARQSVVKLGDPDHLELMYARVIPIGLALADDPHRVLIVGLGGGTLPMLFRKHFPRLEIDAVEIDPQVVRVAKKYFGFREDPAMRVHVADGRKFIEQSREAYDVIFLDAFGADNIPYALATEEFLQSVRRALKDDGLVVGNIWSRWSNPLYDSMVRTYQEVFPEVHLVDVRGAGNRLLLGMASARELDRQQAVAAARRLAGRVKLRYPLAELVENGFRGPGEDGREGRVLRDADRSEQD